MNQNNLLLSKLLPNRNGSSEGNSSITTKLMDEVNSLRQELEKTKERLEEERRQRLEDRLDALEKELQELKTKPTDAELRRIDLVDKKVSEILDIVKVVIRSSIEPAEHKPPERQEEENVEPSVEELLELGVPVENGGGELKGEERFEKDQSRTFEGEPATRKKQHKYIA